MPYEISPSSLQSAPLVSLNNPALDPPGFLENESVSEAFLCDVQRERLAFRLLPHAQRWKVCSRLWDALFKDSESFGLI